MGEGLRACGSVAPLVGTDGMAALRRAEQRRLDHVECCSALECACPIPIEGTFALADRQHRKGIRPQIGDLF
jgi:hypothetical protein